MTWPTVNELDPFVQILTGSTFKKQAEASEEVTDQVVEEADAFLRDIAGLFGEDDELEKVEKEAAVEKEETEEKKDEEEPKEKEEAKQEKKTSSTSDSAEKKAEEPKPQLTDDDKAAAEAFAETAVNSFIETLNYYLSGEEKEAEDVGDEDIDVVEYAIGLVEGIDTIPFIVEEE